MTRKEITNFRDLTLSGWIREKLPDSSTGLMVSDLDFVLYNFKTKKLVLLEIKTRNSELKTWQRNMFKNISEWIAKGIDKDWKYHGFNVLKFENTFFNDGKVYFNDNEMSEREIIEMMNLFLN